MANGDDDPRVYQALALPDKALEDGGVEILRLGIIKDELYVSAVPAFTAPAQWGEVLAEVAERLGAIYAAQNTALDKKDVTVQIAEAFDYLDAPPTRVTGKDVPMPYAANLEKLALPNVDEVIAAVNAVTYRS